MGTNASLSLADAVDGTTIVRAQAVEGEVEFADLVLPGGDYLVTLDPPAATPAPYVLAAEGTNAPVGDPEPNDTAERAVPLVGDKPLARGRLSRPLDDDWYRLAVTDGLAAASIDVRLIWGTPRPRELCLFAPSGELLLCRSGNEGINVPGLALPAGEYSLRVRGDADPDDVYLLRVDPAGLVPAGFEREPNDTPDLATATDPSVVARGRALGVDVDYFRARIDGDPQLWQVDARGHGISALTWVRANGERLADGAVSADHASATMTDLYLPPGEHWLRVTAEDGEYALELTPLGPPDPAGEREPNDLPSREERLVVGEERTGRLPTVADVDVYRFTVHGPDRLVLTLDPPADGDVDVAISDDINAARTLRVPGGADIREDLALGPGDYRLTLTTARPGQEPYRIGLTRPDPVQADSGLSAALELPDTMLAAWWPSGQRLSATTRLVNSGTKDLEVELDAAATDRAWKVEMVPSSIGVPAGGEAVASVELTVPPEIPAGESVRVTVEALVSGAVQTSAWVDLVPTGDALPTQQVRMWPVPDALLGGLDVASEALGAVPIPSLDPEGERRLHDGYAASDWGLSYPIGALPVALTVDLAGDEPVPVAGTILQPLSADPTLGDSVRDFELALSLDGGTWQTVLAGTLDPVADEQAFVLEDPMEARYAQLRVSSVQRESPSRLDLGEWKVVAPPGWSTGGGSLDLADPPAGGHVAWMRPQPDASVEMASILVEDPGPVRLSTDPGGSVEWVVGFRDDRAAQISSIEWQDPLPSDPAARLREVEVWASIDGPLGPWRSLGRWPLERRADGTVDPLRFEEPVWARFLRFAGSADRKQRAVELPERVRVLEAAASNAYRSVLGQWGMGQPSGPWEWQREPDKVPADDDGGAPDSSDRPRELRESVAVEGRVHYEQDEDWYRVVVPEGHHSLALTLGSPTSVGAAVALRTSDASPVPVVFGAGDETGSVTYLAAVEPGEAYTVQVFQPRSSIVVTFDTSASVATQLSAILAGLRSLADGMADQREAVRIVPFDEQPLLPGWSDDPLEITDALNRFSLSESSSAAEANLRDAATDLAAREGGRAVMLVTDAATSSKGDTAELWSALASSRPRVFAVEVGGEGERPAIERHHLMADWAMSSGARATYARGGADVQAAFDRLATTLRRPVAYTLKVQSSPEQLPPPPPGHIAVLAPEVGGVRPAVIGKDAAIALVLDTSGSMRKRLEGRRRIDVAKAVLTTLVREDIPPGVDVSLRSFSGEKRSCSSVSTQPMGPLDPDLMAEAIEGLDAPKPAGTPLAASIAAVAEDLAGVTGPRIVVVVSDGKEGCRGDPGREAQRLRQSGIDVTLNLVGLALDKKTRHGNARIAKLGGGTYFDAADAETLGEALRAAISAPFEVRDGSGELVARGTVGGDPVDAPSGIYEVRVLVEPPVVFEDVFLRSDADVTLTMPVAEH